MKSDAEYRPIGSMSLFTQANSSAQLGLYPRGALLTRALMPSQ
jgi:hypothetical protein